MSGAGGPGARMEPISVKIPEAVRLTGLSCSRLYELMKSGDVEFAKVGSSTLILFDSLPGFILGRNALKRGRRRMSRCWNKIPKSQ